MSDIGFKPHEPINAEETFTEFVRKFGGEVISERLSRSPSFKNADFYFPAGNVISELKCFQTDFPRLKLYGEKLFELQKKWISESQISWAMIWEKEPLPLELRQEYVRLFRTPLQGILKKANKQIRDTKKNLGFASAQGLLIILNDGLYGLQPATTVALISSILINQYSAIDGFVYLTLNKYVDIPGDDYARLVWWPVYSDRAGDNLVGFVNDLGRNWFTFLEDIIGPFDAGVEIPEEGHKVLERGRFIE